MFLRPQFSLRAGAEPWPSIRHLESVARAISNVVDDAYWNAPLFSSDSRSGYRFDRTKSGGVFRVEMPGVDSAALELTVQGNELIIKSKAAKEGVFPKDGYVKRERPPAGFSEKFRFDFTIDPETTVASFVDGVLTVELVNIDDESPKKIPVSVH